MMGGGMLGTEALNLDFFRFPENCNFWGFHENIVNAYFFLLLQQTFEFP